MPHTGDSVWSKPRRFFLTGGKGRGGFLMVRDVLDQCACLRHYNMGAGVGDPNGQP